MALRTPRQYVENLEDVRVVYFEGKRVEALATHPNVSITNRWVAMNYVFGNAPCTRTV